MDIKNLKAVIKMITETDITEFEMETDGEKLIIKRGTASQYTVPSMPAPAGPTFADTPSTGHTAPPTITAGVTVKEPDAEAGFETIVSPIVGTFYRSPAPDSESYVEIGSEVGKGQVLCIIEAMKLMNEIEAEFKCRIVKILKENAQPVEFGEPLFLVEPI
jgi:acetyl-CoA carboxylase biotin carboxyl carrier protein